MSETVIPDSIPTNYHEFRKSFLEEVQLRGLQLQSIQHRGLSPQGRPLFTDLAYTVYNPNLPTLVHMSGCHGIEGYLGSAIQTEILRNLEGSTYQNLNLVFVHAMNPWAMAWYRRVNAHNVDLNRNFFLEGAPRPENLNFNVFSPLMEKRPQLKPWRIWKRILFFLFKKGFRHSVNTVAQGQYHLPDALFYGGTALQPEVVEILRASKHLLQGSKPIYLIDVHSGLGKFGSENWIFDGHQSDAELELWRKCLEIEVPDSRSEKEFYHAHGTLTEAYRKTFSPRIVCCVVEEFGTYSSFKVFKQLIHENKVFLKLILDRYRSYQMISTFFPFEKQWRTKCIAQGKESFFKVAKNLRSF